VPYVPRTDPVKDDPDVCPATPFGPGREWRESVELTHGVGTAGPYFPYDPDDPRFPIKPPRLAGFVPLDCYVKGEIVYRYKHKRKKRPVT
jgi:hypothetical protein